MDIGNVTNQFQQMTQQTQVVAQGNFGGQQVTINDPLSLILNSAEEASFAMSEREESRLAERKMKPKGPGTERVEQVEKYLELMDKQGKSRPLDSFISSLSNTTDLDARGAVGLALKYFEDKADAYSALQYAKQELGDKFGEDLFFEAMAQLYDIAGKEIKTRLAAGVTALEHETLGDAEGLKDLYEATLSDLGSPVDIFERMMNDYGEDRFEESLAFLNRTLGNDMGATTVNTDKVQLEGIAKDLGTVRLLQSLNSQCKTLIDRVEKILEK